MFNEVLHAAPEEDGTVSNVRPTVPTGAAMTSRDDTTIRCHEVEAGPAVVLANGAGQTSGNLPTTPEDLADQFALYPPCRSARSWHEESVRRGPRHRQQRRGPRYLRATSDACRRYTYRSRISQTVVMRCST